LDKGCSNLGARNNAILKLSFLKWGKKKGVISISPMGVSWQRLWF